MDKLIDNQTAFSIFHSRDGVKARKYRSSDYPFINASKVNDSTVKCAAGGAMTSSESEIVKLQCWQLRPTLILSSLRTTRNPHAFLFYHLPPLYFRQLPFFAVPDLPSFTVVLRGGFNPASLPHCWMPTQPSLSCLKVEADL